MKEISSTENKIYKICIKMASRKYRDEYRTYIVEGPNLLEEAIMEKAMIDFVVFRKGKEQEINKLLNAGITQDQIYLMPDGLFEKITQTENSQGVFAAIKMPENNENNFFRHCAGGSGNILVLDRLQDPGNIGTIIRTADAAGYEGIIVIKGTADLFSPKTVRAATGSLFRMPLYFSDTPEKAAALIKKNGKKLVGTCFDTDRFFYQEDIKKNVALTIGNEGNGISHELLKLCDLKIKIPMCGNVESLNAAVAAGILMYETMRNSKEERGN